MTSFLARHHLGHLPESVWCNVVEFIKFWPALRVVAASKQQIFLREIAEVAWHRYVFPRSEEYFLRQETKASRFALHMWRLASVFCKRFRMSSGEMSLPNQSPYPKIVIRQIRFNTGGSVIERFLCQMGFPPLQVYVCRRGEYWPGKRTSCLVTFQTWDATFRAFNELRGLEVHELADVPLEIEIATRPAIREPAQQPPIRA